MPRMRTLKPEAATSETLCEVPRQVRWTFGLLWTHCDDDGRALWNPKLVKAALYPLDDDVTTKVLAGEVEALERIGALCIYVVDGKQYLHVPSWHEHQHPNRRVDSKLPPCPGGVGAEHVQQATNASAVTTHARRTERAVSRQEPLTSVVVVGDVDGGVDGEGEASALERPASAPRPPTPTVNQRAQRLAKAYCDRVPLSKFPAIQGIAIKAINANRYTDEQIEQAFLRLAAEGRSVTTETVRIELDGQPPPRNGRPTADDKVRGGLDLAERLAAERNRHPEQRQLGA